MCQPHCVIYRDRNDALKYAKQHDLRYDTERNYPQVKQDSEYNNYVYPGKVEKYVAGYIVHVSFVYSSV